MLLAASLTIGDEILVGEIQDTNSSWLTERLVDAGIDPCLHQCNCGNQKSVFPQSDLW